MLTVWCMSWGSKYGNYYVRRLQADVRRWLTVPHRFVCITDKVIEGVACRPPAVDYPGWWGKVQLFSPFVAADLNLWLDLDVVITGTLDPLVENVNGLTAPENWAQSGHGGVQSSVMAWRNGDALEVFDLFSPDMAHWPPRNEPGVLWGDQEWITRLRDRGVVDVAAMDPDWVKSYKYHCRGGLPPGTKVVVFHGEPKPQDVRESWFRW